jgi:hypothetical protein
MMKSKRRVKIWNSGTQESDAEMMVSVWLRHTGKNEKREGLQIAFSNFIS